MKSQHRPRVLVTGARGLIYSYAAPYMDGDREIIATDIHASPGVQRLDLLDYDAVVAAMEGVDAVVHLAIATRRELKHLSRHEIDDEQMRVNVSGTFHILHAAAEMNVSRVVYMSSMTVVMGDPRLPRFAHDMPPRPRDLYAQTKLTGEHLCELYARTRGLTAICLRLGHPIATQPWSFDSEITQRGVKNGLATAHEDIAHGLNCALTCEDVKFHVSPLVSRCEADTVDLTGANVIGYEPKVEFKLDGELIRHG
jgi:nucleoside-diphosphate-sugar epimerase